MGRYVVQCRPVSGSGRVMTRDVLVVGDSATAYKLVEVGHGTWLSEEVAGAVKADLEAMRALGVTWHVVQVA